MKKLILLFLLLVFVFTPVITSAKIDDSHIKSVAQVKIWDKLKSSYIATGSGIFFEVANMNVLTNYHVVEKAITNPDRYLPVVCVTKNPLSLPDCRGVFSVRGLSGSDDIHAINNKWLNRRPIALAVHKTETVLFPNMETDDDQK